MPTVFSTFQSQGGVKSCEVNAYRFRNIAYFAGLRQYSLNHAQVNRADDD